MSFDYHSDAVEHAAFAGPLGLAALGLWTRCGSWTSANVSHGVVPTDIAESMGDGELIEHLVSHGLWHRTAAGYEMTHGPLPLWRYGSKPDDGRLISIDTDSLR